MSVLNAIQSLFGGNATVPQGNTPPNPNAPTGNPNPGQPLPGTHASTVTAPNGVIPSANPGQQPAPGQVPTEPVSPLTPFANIWETPTTPNPNDSPAIFGAVDPKKVMESARQANFTSAVTPEQMAAITAGGEGAAKAVGEMLQNVAQTVYGQSALATAKIVEQALTKQQEQFDARLPSLVRKHSVNDSIRTENPLLNNPAVAPLVGALTEQLTRKNPNATQTEIRTQLNDYFTALGNTFRSQSPQEVQANVAAKSGTDWDKFLA